MKKLLTLRAKIIYRIALEIGWLRSAFIIGLLIYLFFQVFALKNSYIILSINILTIFSLQTTRTDKSFLRSASVPFKQLFILEYFILSIPFILYFAFNQHLIELIGLVLALPMISLINLTFKTQQLRSLSFAVVPASVFEWRAGLRQSWFFILLAYIGSAIFYQSVTIIVLCNLLLIINLASFYLQGESKTLLQLPQLTPLPFLVFKVKYHVLFSTFLVFPFALLLFTVHPELWFLAVLLLVINLFMQIFAILQKYAVWSPNSNLQPNMTLYLFYFISFVIPFLLPVGIFLFIGAYRKAVKNLKLVIIN
jgi:hypothetical protein